MSRGRCGGDRPIGPCGPGHAEVGFACDDPTLVEEATAFVADVIAFSEPIDTTCAGPEPNLVQVEFDDAAMAEAMEEMAEPDDDGEDW